MWLSVVALALAADPAPGSADAVFKQMDQSVRAARTFRTDLEVTLATGKADAKPDTLKGRLLVAAGDKMRLELAGTVGGRAGKLVMVSDGTRMRVTNEDRPGKDQDTTRKLGEITLASVARTGVFVPLFLTIDMREDGKEPEPFELEKQFQVSDLKLGKKEAVGGRDAQAVDYTVAVKGNKEPLAVTVWVDEKTHLPVKRTVRVKEGAETMTVTETYARAAVGEKLDDKEFALPK